MGKHEELHTLKKDLYKKLYELIEDENEIEIIENELYREKTSNKKVETTRRGMIKALTEDFFSKVLQIAGEEEKIEQNEK